MEKTYMNNITIISRTQKNNNDKNNNNSNIKKSNRKNKNNFYNRIYELQKK